MKKVLEKDPGYCLWVLQQQTKEAAGKELLAFAKWLQNAEVAHAMQMAIGGPPEQPTPQPPVDLSTVTTVIADLLGMLQNQPSQPGPSTGPCPAAQFPDNDPDSEMPMPTIPPPPGAQATEADLQENLQQVLTQVSQLPNANTRTQELIALLMNHVHGYEE